VLEGTKSLEPPKLLHLFLCFYDGSLHKTTIASFAQNHQRWLWTKPPTLALHKTTNAGFGQNHQR